MMEDAYPQLYRIAQTRFSCRDYSPRTVDRDTILAVLDIVRLAPSACNRQPWLFLVADTPEQRDAILGAYPRPWLATAPAFIVACGLHGEAWHRGADGKDHTDVDVSIAVEHLCLAATSLGLATCWVCNFDTAAVREAFAIPEGVEPVAIIPLGYPAEGLQPAPKTRKSLDEIVRWGKF